MNTPPIFIVSGGAGMSGEQVVRTALAQFQQIEAPIEIISQVHRASQVEEVVARAAAKRGIIVHTLVDTSLRRLLIQLAHDRDVVAIDLIGQLISHLATALEQEPLNQPGLYRRLRQDYFDRISAIEFTLAHDDGKDPAGLHLAEVVIVGVSRVGKTPLSIYLSTKGWKVANVPIIRHIEPPIHLFEIDPHRVIALTIEPGQLIIHRQSRQSRMGVSKQAAYTDPTEIYEELESARQLFRKAGFYMIDITDKPLEETAEEVLTRIDHAHL